ncbi:hypothetical protein ZEAMMB73_Zm00001d028032 [Zea mays]|uniref:Cation-transporting P-type ATPase C-terminal domain-containing protein n=1 Tax=Zea mays TaxID=4577 RepID=A0A1D6JRD2_MAIZE|nr:hypothetical protein ZEAMMB73_Zm00001d028032 [Zea mays]
MSSSSHRLTPLALWPGRCSLPLRLSLRPPSQNHRAPPHSTGCVGGRRKEGEGRRLSGEMSDSQAQITVRRRASVLLAASVRPSASLLPASREPLVTNIMWRNLFVQALYQVAILLIFDFDGVRILRLQNESRSDAEKIFNEFNARKPEEKNVFKGVTKNHLFMGIIGITTVFQILIIQFLGKFFKIVRLGWRLWLVSVAIGLDEVLYTIVPASETGGPSGAAKAEGRGTGERELGSQVKVPDRTKPAREGEAGEGAHVAVHGRQHQGPRQKGLKLEE